MLFLMFSKTHRTNFRWFSTVDSKEVEHFKKMADFWWDTNNSTLRGLHALNAVRVPFIKNGILASHPAKKPNEISVLDVGCGAGILTEALARLNFKQVIGLDASETLIKVAKNHCEPQCFTNLSYIWSTIEDHAEKYAENYDVVVMSETIEHVNKQELFLSSAIKCLRPGGSVFISTPNKNFASTFVNIFIAEYVWAFIEKGTHQSDKFISRKELVKMLKRENCELVSRYGLFYNPVTIRWYLSKNFDFLWYIIHAVKQNQK